MTKSQLETGMIVVCNNRTAYLILKETEVGVKEGSWIDLSTYKEDLTNPYNRDYDIAEIYHPKQWDTIACLTDYTKFTPVWRREKPTVELTLEQVAKKFNIDVEQLRIKDN